MLSPLLTPTVPIPALEIVADDEGDIENVIAKRITAAQEVGKDAG